MVGRTRVVSYKFYELRGKSIGLEYQRYLSFLAPSGISKLLSPLWQVEDPPPSYLFPPSPSEPGHLTTILTLNLSDSIDEGCFQLSNMSNIYPPPGNYELAELIPYKCIVMCAPGSSKLASLTNGEVCVCLNTVSGIPSSCTKSCPGDASFNCGGQSSFRVFNLSTLIRNEPQLQFSSTPKFLEEAQYQLNLVNETTSYGYQLAYKSTKFLNKMNTDLVFGGSYPNTFTAWGKDVEVTIVVIGKVRQEFRRTVEVNPPLNVSNIKCPTYVTVGFAFECSGRLYLGKEVNTTWSLDESSETITLAG